MQTFVQQRCKRPQSPLRPPIEKITALMWQVGWRPGGGRELGAHALAWRKIQLLCRRRLGDLSAEQVLLAPTQCRRSPAAPLCAQGADPRPGSLTCCGERPDRRAAQLAASWSSRGACPVSSVPCLSRRPLQQSARHGAARSSAAPPCGPTAGDRRRRPAAAPLARPPLATRSRSSSSSRLARLRSTTSCPAAECSKRRARPATGRVPPSSGAGRWVGLGWRAPCSFAVPWLPFLNVAVHAFLQEATLSTTGFPVPTGFGSGSALPPPGSGMLWRLRNPARTDAPARRRAGGGAAAGGDEADDADRPPLVPVFRAAPYSAEAARQRRQSPTARILFLDDGCTCRAPLAQALMAGMLRWVLGCWLLAGRLPDRAGACMVPSERQACCLTTAATQAAAAHSLHALLPPGARPPQQAAGPGAGR